MLMVVTDNEVQTVTINAAGGTFTLSFGGQTTSAIAWNAAGSAVQTALRALSTIGSTGVNVTGNGPYTVTFTGALQTTDVSALTSDATLLTGGAQTAVVTTAAQGDAPVTQIVYADTSANGTITNAEVLIGQTPPVGEVLVGKSEYYG